MTLQERGLAFLLLANTGKAIESFQELYTLHRQYFGDYSQTCKNGDYKRWSMPLLVTTSRRKSIWHSIKSFHLGVRERFISFRYFLSLILP
jgi:hypothetical protein